MALGFFSIVAFALYGLDKHKAVKRKKRIRESTLLLFSCVGGIGALLGMLVFHHKTKKWKFRILVPLFVVIDLLIAVYLVWSSGYYNAGTAAEEAIKSDDVVKVQEYRTHWLFDGPSKKKALVFYPGAKVEEKAYAPVFHEIAAKEMDVLVVKMPYRFAVFGWNDAKTIVKNTFYIDYYIGGHSLGGAMASFYAARHEKSFSGMILLASYPVMATNLDTLLIYGSEDKILNMDRVKAADDLVSGTYEEDVIEGGNHAQFGDYGLQKDDGTASISPEEQWEYTIDKICDFVPGDSSDISSEDSDDTNKDE